MERVVGRADLYSDDEPTSSPESPDDGALEKFKGLNALELQPTRESGVADANEAQQVGHLEGEDEEEELAFNLFAPKATSSTSKTDTTSDPPPKKIRLRSPSIDNSNPGFINPHRDPSYYFAATSLDDSAEFTSTAFSGREILKMSQSYWPGSSYGWRCLHLPRSAEPRSIRSQVSTTTGFRRLLGDGGEMGEAKKRRARLGKKSRIKVRVRSAATRTKAETKRKGDEDREMAESEKRNKRNREKKIKRRARERAKKAAAAGTGNSEVAKLEEVGSGSDDGDE